MKTGSVKNVAAFEKLVGMCNDLGTRYNPSKTDISTTALAALLEQATTQLEAVENARNTYANAVNTRQTRFDALDSLASRVVRALIASGADAKTVNDAWALKRKMTSSQKKSIVPVNTGEEGGADQTSNGVSYRDYENIASIFSQLIKHVQSTAVYAPNEADLTVPALKASLAALRNASTEVTVAVNALAKARNQRNTVLSGKGGLHEIGTAVKAYIRSVCGLKNYPASELGKLKLV